MSWTVEADLYENGNPCWPVSGPDDAEGNFSSEALAVEYAKCKNAQNSMSDQISLAVTVGELIEMLKDCPADALVFTYPEGGGLSGVQDVSLVRYRPAAYGTFSNPSEDFDPAAPVGYVIC